MPIGTEIDFIGPGTVTAGTSSTNFTMTPVSPFSGTYTPATTFGGSFTPSSVTWVASMAAKTFVYNAPNTNGTATIAPTQTAGVDVGDLTPPTLDIVVSGATRFRRTLMVRGNAGGRGQQY